MGGIEFLDVDHTLTRRSSGSRFVTLAMRRRIIPLRLLLAIPWYSMTYKLGFFRLRDYAGGFPYLRGIPRATLEDIGRESFDAKLKSDLFGDAVALVRRLQAEGRRVMLATSSIDFIVAPLAAYLDVAGVLATSLEFVDGACTGRIDGIPMFRWAKKDRVLAFLSTQDIDPKECSFYSDSIYDLSLLECVGRPVAVNPDFRLRRVARRRGWTVMRLA